MLQLILEGTSGPLPTSTYGIFHDGIRVGMCQLRHRPSKSADMPSGFESHIYYEIEPPYRGMGYATAALKLLLDEAARAGMSETFLTIDEQNAPSRKVAEQNGAVHIDTAEGAGGKTYFRYRTVLPS